MPKSTNQKMKLLYLQKLFLEETDETHYVTVNDIIGYLQSYDISSERKSLYDDIELLRRFGMDIQGEANGRGYHYHLVSRDFEMPELKLLVDAVQASKFVTEKKSYSLIRKLEGLCSHFEASALQRQVYVAGRIKAMNESIFYNVDILQEAMAGNRKIRFHYFEWTPKKERRIRRNGDYYIVSPWALIWSDENYYLIAYEDASDMIKHFRVDKMQDIETLPDSREGYSDFQSLQIASFGKKTFGMFGGKERTVSLLCDNSMAGVMIDQFGKNIIMVPKGENWFSVNVNVNVSSHFFGWIMALGEKVRITGPADVVDEMRHEIERLQEQYQ